MTDKPTVTQADRDRAPRFLPFTTIEEGNFILDGEPYWAIDPEDSLDWQPTHFQTLTSAKGQADE